MQVLKASGNDAEGQETQFTETPELQKKILVPKERQRISIEVQVLGIHAGQYYLVPYKGKLKNYTIKPVVSMFIPQIRSGKEKLVPVSVVEEDQTIYISKDNYKMYEKGLTAPEGIELRETFFG